MHSQEKTSEIKIDTLLLEAEVLAIAAVLPGVEPGILRVEVERLGIKTTILLF